MIFLVIFYFKEFDLLPQTLLKMPSAQLIGEWYKQSFIQFLRFHELSPSIRLILRRHASVVETMAEALIEWQQTSGMDLMHERSIQYFLDRFYLNRISIRMLLNQHCKRISIFCKINLVAISDPLNAANQQIGHIDQKCNVREIIVDAFENARFLCERFYCISPQLNLKCVNTQNNSSNVIVTLVPLHLYYIMFELIKNAMRATIETNSELDEDLIPDIDVFVVLGKENLSIKISDRGGGIPQKQMTQLFKYLYSTAPRPKRDFSTDTPFAGYGFGLPISRLYARYFLGDMYLFSMDGHGTDACVVLKAIPTEASELLPVYGASSRRFITMGNKVSDWCYQLPKNQIEDIYPDYDGQTITKHHENDEFFIIGEKKVAMA